MNCNQSISKRVAGSIVHIVWVWFISGVIGGSGLAQDALRNSLTGQRAAEERKNAESIPYNLKAGPVSFRLNTSLGFEFNDNVNVAETDRQADLILRPLASIDSLWPMTQQNTLFFSVGIGYAKYINNPENDSLVIQPNSALSFDVFIGDFKINLHDRFSYVQDPLQQASISGGTNAAAAGRFGSSDNAVGFSVDWDLSKILLSFGFDHHTSFATSTNFSYLDLTSELFFLRGAYLVSPQFTAGLEASAGITDYDQPIQNDNQQFSFGPFLDWQLTQNLKVNLRAGYVTYHFEDNGINTNSSDNSSYYAAWTFSHQINQYLTQYIAVGTQVQLGVNSNSLKLYYARHHGLWRIVRNTDVRSEIFYEHGTESGAFTPETFARYGVRLSLGYQLTRKLNTGLAYQFTYKNSDLPLRDYSQNSVTLTLLYRF